VTTANEKVLLMEVPWYACDKIPVDYFLGELFTVDEIEDWKRYSLTLGIVD